MGREGEEVGREGVEVGRRVIFWERFGQSAGVRGGAVAWETD